MTTVYLRQVPAPSLRPNEWNQLAILAIRQEHWFYINDAFVGYQMIPRLPYARLDVGIVAGAQAEVRCHFQDFRVYGPPDVRLYPTLENLIGRVLE